MDYRRLGLPNEERLLSYALDQAVEVKSEVKTSPSPDMNVKIGGADLTANYKMRKTRTYTIRNRAGVRWTMTWDAGFNLVQAIQGPLGRRTSFSYNASNLIRRIQDPGGRIITLTVNANQDLTQIVNDPSPRGEAETFTR